MSKDLTTSAVARSNVLNNRYALNKLEEHLALGGLRIEGEVLFFKSHVAELLAIDERTIDRYLASQEDELKRNGYRILKEKYLKNIKLAKVDDIHVADLIGAKVPGASADEPHGYRKTLERTMFELHTTDKPRDPSRTLLTPGQQCLTEAKFRIREARL